MQRTNINPEILQAMLDSAANAADKGQSQFFTPIPFAQKLAEALPRARPVIVDLQCGIGNLLVAASTEKTGALLGSDIDPCRAEKPPPIPITRITHDATLLYGLLKELDFKADLFTLNPPFRLFQYRNRFTDLEQSQLPAVRDAFAATESNLNGVPKGTIDSTIVTLLMALDMCTTYGEGFLIANNATLDRLLFEGDGTNPPLHGSVARHVWARLIIPGNPMTGIQNCQWQEEKQFYTGVIYFARDHAIGCKSFRYDSLEEFMASDNLSSIRLHRQGAELSSDYLAKGNTAELWSAARERIAEMNGRKPKVPWNLWLHPATQTIKTALSLFEQNSVKIKKADAARLHDLDGQSPMELVLQRAQRDELLSIVGLPLSPGATPPKTPWRVEPALIDAVRKAVNDYHAARAPLYPLPEIQRLGYLDEADQITCKKDLAGAGVVFQSGQPYTIRTQTVTITRKVKKPNPMTGEDEDLEFTGQELAIFLKANESEYCFMDAKLRDDKSCEVPNAKQQKTGARVWTPEAIAELKAARAKSAIDFTLQELCEHFTIPDVPDVATANPQGYEANLKLLEELEQITEAAVAA